MRKALGSDRRVWFVMACWVVGCVLALGQAHDPGVPTELWPPIGIGFVGLTLLWDGDGRPGRGALVATAAMAAVFVVVGLAFSNPPDQVLLMALLNLAAVWATTVIYLRVKGSPGWAPRGARSLASIAGAAVLAATPVSLLGGFSGQPALELTPLTLWWIIRSSMFAFIGAATFLTFFHGDLSRWRRLPRPSRTGLGLLVPVSLACMYVVYLDPDLPLSWFLLIPAVWAGVMLSPFAAGIHALMQSLAAGVLAFTEADRFSYVGFLPSSLIIDLLLVASTFITMQIALLRDERERALAAERAQRRQADAQSTLLGQVFDSMTDGMMLFNDGALVRHNPSARHLLGRPLPARPAEGWASYLGLSSVEGRPLDEPDLPGTAGLRRHRSTVTIDHDRSKRLLEISSWPISGDDILVLLTDVTNQRHRLDELSRFAGIVSHDLRTPLTSLHGWLEMAHEAAENGEDVAPLLKRAEASSRRMERVIGGWINYTVVREGGLTPEPVPISELVGEAGESSSEDSPGTLRITNHAPHLVRADRVLGRQLFGNLIGNAVKFARPGEPAHVEITSREDDEPGWIRIEVADRGVGLTPGEEELIFEEFHRDPQQAQGVEGTGLGLSLCRTIVTRHGGSIVAFTNDHGGATFSMTLPAATPPG
ncbi:PAS domain-containing sensor histidine kinase [Nocardioides currus]|uniref:Sensor-like histidine kinase SenX3 n=1 Tax=Nocardioides currus TaxID=2133958 RepID=A0A2R7YX20_9ACTN|nr:PAS domain-containing sensor histidine kinase [Nocardioides currus]PUA80918.1 hypothetical protein C7S10_10980 [Nocardioides currus]